ncbi:MAG TPA: serine/threonine-protein phosphatase [Leptolyngbyaceae cyanobacterium M65_K2018_010]|nr:serine/threonine-protein phosphatase [Leptolyngbyaceae cyanobacterium M65_K2018_010]
MVEYQFSGLTDPGLIRVSNQDDYYIDPEGRFFIVADGMGGHAGGQEASRLATASIKTFLNHHWQDSRPTDELLKQALGAANRAILHEQRLYPDRSDMGTTVVVLTFRPQDAQPWCAHVGDSRLYRLRDHSLEQLTEDHTWIAKAIRQGDLSPDQSRNHPWRHVLSHCLGREDLAQAQVQPIQVQPGDRLLMCSDGLTEELSDQLIAKHLTAHQPCEAAATALVNSAKEHGGRDNITVIIVNPMPPAMTA